jgi:hypothetical protein
MAYKVLGQVLSTAPSTANSIVNLVKDPSFENLTITSAVTSASSSLVYVIPGTNNYWQGNNDHTTSFFFRSGQRIGLTADSGSQALVTSPSTVLPGNGLVKVYYGHVLGSTSSTIQDQNKVDRDLAARLDKDTTHYYGAKYYCPSTTGVGTAQVQVTYWSADGNVVGTANTSVATLTAGSWQTLSGSFSPGASRYATIRLQYQANSSMPTTSYVAWDSVWVSDNATYNGTYPNPDGTTILTAPFNDNGITYGGTLAASESIRSYPGTLTDLYTVPAGSSAVVSTITVNNLNTRFAIGSNTPGYTQTVPVRIAVLPSGQTLAKKHFMVFDAPVSTNTTQTFTIGMTLAAGDKIQVSAPTSDVTFTAFGSEN